MHVPPPSRAAAPAAGIAQRLAWAIERVGSRAAVAKAIGVSPSTLHEYVHGAEIKLSTLLKLADVCQVSVEWLITGKGDEPPPVGPLRAKRSSNFHVVFATEPQEPVPRPTQIDADILAQAMQIVEAIAAGSQPPMPLLTRARRIAIAYDQLTLPDTALAPLPPYVPRNKP